MSETFVSDSAEDFFSIGKDTDEKEIDTSTFLTEIKKEQINTKFEQEKKEINSTYNENLDKAKQDESFEELRNLSFQKGTDYLVTRQKWRGNIIEVGEDTFLAKLHDLSEGGTDEIAEFEKREVHYSERDLISLGSVFYFYLAYRISMGTLSKETVLKFQKPITWKVIDFDRASDRAARLAKHFEKKRAK